MEEELVNRFQAEILLYGLDESFARRIRLRELQPAMVEQYMEELAPGRISSADRFVLAHNLVGVWTLVARESDESLELRLQKLHRFWDSTRLSKGEFIELGDALLKIFRSELEVRHGKS